MCSGCDGTPVTSRLPPPHTELALSSPAPVLTRPRPHCRPCSRYNASQLSWLIDGSGRTLVNCVIKLEELEAMWPVLQVDVASAGG